jgi:uncharacterized protein YfaS (alpha-2-macroglobulin family)
LKRRLLPVVIREKDAPFMSRFLCFILVLVFSLPAFAADPPVQLLLPSRILKPDSTFELRFANEMVSADQIGKPMEPSPLIIEPPVPGRFVWLSTRSGTFAPEGVLPLGTKFKMSLRAGLKDLSGKPVASTLRETAETPPFGVKGVSVIGYNSEENATVLPRHLVLFNANVNAASAAKFVRYVNAAGGRMEARVEQADDPKNRDRRFPMWQSDDRSLAAWGEKTDPPASVNDGEESEGEEGAEDDPTAKLPPPQRNVLYVAPVKPLPPAAGWRLVFEQGLPAAEGKIALPTKREIDIGTVQPFAAATVAAESNRYVGRRIIVTFNKSLSEEANRETIGNWIKIEPPAANLKATIEDTIVTFKGEFALNTKYRVTVNAGLPAQEPTTTTAPSTKEVAFTPIAPRLYFLDFATHQLLSGTRELRLQAMNVPRIRVSAKLFTGDEIPAAVKAYDKYQERPDDLLPDESYMRVNVEAVPGRPLWTQDFTPQAPVDAEQTIALKWDEIIGANRSGVVVLTAESIDPVIAGGKRVGSQTLVQLTDLGAVWKRDREATFMHLFSLASGKGIGSARLRLLDGEGAELARATTDEKGEARLPKKEEARWVFAETESDAHLVAIESYENVLPLYRLGVTEDTSQYDQEGRNSNTIFMFTERGVYKPGDKVFLKGYAQDFRDDQPRIPAGKRVTLTLSDAKERQILSEEVTLSEFGSFDRELVLPQGSLGRYRISAVGEKGERLGGSVSFQVQEYKPNAFEILIPAPPATFGSTQLALPITAKYFMGKPLSKAKLTWSLVARDEPLAPEGLGNWAFGNAIYDFRLSRALDKISQYNAQGEVAIGESGTVEVRTPLPVNPKAPQPRAAKLLTEVTDLNQQTVSESRSFVQHSSDFYFGLKRFDAVVAEGQPLPIELIAVKPDGSALDAPARATLRLTRIKWQTNRIATAGDTSDFDSKAQLEVIWEKELATLPGLGSDRKPAIARLEQALADKPGEYLLEAIGKDSAGRDVVTSVVLSVSGEAETDWNYRNQYAIDLVADKDSYEPGETATLMLKTPIAGDALVTVERDRVMRSFIVPLTGNAPSVQVPIARTDGPNVFVSVMLLRGANESPRKVKTPEYRVGYANLKIARPHEKLAVR